MKNLIILLGGIIVFASCQKDITDDVDLNDSEPKMVIEANYSAEDSTVRVHISMTSSYFNNDPAPAINGATVTIVDYLGNSTNLIGLGDGDYELTGYAPIFNTSYTLNVNSGGETYTSSCFMHDPVQLDPITPYFVPGFFGAGPGYVVNWNFQDPAGEVNFYMAILTVNGNVKDSVTQRYLQDDALTDGNEVSRPIGDFIDKYQIGDTVEIEMQTIDKIIYDYYDELISVASGGGQAAPANPYYMWSNNALGYFSAYSSAREQVVIN